MDLDEVVRVWDFCRCGKVLEGCSEGCPTGGDGLAAVGLGVIEELEAESGVECYKSFGVGAESLG